jgi:hypothetical protein
MILAVAEEVREHGRRFVHRLSTSDLSSMRQALEGSCEYEKLPALGACFAPLATREGMAFPQNSALPKISFRSAINVTYSMP